MNKIYFIQQMLLATILITATILTSCNDDEDETIIIPTPPEKSDPLEDSEAGTFVITNVSANEEIQGSYYQCFVGDTLKVVFQPKQQYSSFDFNITASRLTKIGNDLFLVPDLDTSLGGGVSFGKNIEFEAANNTNGNKLSAKMSVPFFTYVPEADVTYSLSISSELLPFIDVTLDYTTDNGTAAKPLTNSDWVRDTVYAYVFISDDGKEMHSSSNADREGYTLTDSIPYYSAHYRLNMHYTKLDTDYTITARYTPKTEVEATEDSYYFRHSLSWGPATICGASVNNVSISIGGKTDIKREEVASYLEKLSTTPDIVKLHLSKRERKISEIK